LSFSLARRNSQMLTVDGTQFSVLVLTHIADPAASRSAEVRLQSSPKCAANIGIANMRAGRKINRRQNRYSASSVWLDVLKNLKEINQALSL
jgi:hypothetical protein